jgi:hydrogenase/urease accessory protein HupE
MNRLARTLCLLSGVLLSLASQAHELKTVTLRFDEFAQGVTDATLRVPQMGEETPHTVVPAFDDRCVIQGLAHTRRDSGTIERRWRLNCQSGLANTRIQLHGLDPRMPEALVIANFASGAQETLAMDRHDPVRRLGSGEHHADQSLSRYVLIGISHILLGPDHLLFVFGLMLIIAAQRRGAATLIAAITAFTLAHSLTLALALFGVWGLPPKPVEILIAGSILLLAYELLTHDPAQPSISFRQPWRVAFGFGLLHGFGFAGALSEVGLPAESKAWALLYFNLGVEIGQLAFVLALWQCMKRFRWGNTHPFSPGAAIALGGIASYWLFDRTSDWLITHYQYLSLGGLQ